MINEKGAARETKENQSGQGFWARSMAISIKVFEPGRRNLYSVEFLSR
jgi:hypothetical protein